MKVLNFLPISLLILVFSFSVLVSVGPASGAAPDEEVVIVDLLDHSFKPAMVIKKKQLRLFFVNRGIQDHEVVLIRLQKGVTVKAYLEASEKGAPTRHLGRPVKNVPPMTSGAQGTLSMTLEPGQYMLACFVADPKTGKPHLLIGMAHGFSVS